MSGIVFQTAAQLLDFGTGPLGTSDFVTVTQQRINQFADATGDHQWIHVDPARAADGPFGGCIAHGYLTLALTSDMLFQILDVRAQAQVNYGVNKVRFPAPVPVESRICGRAEMLSAEQVKDGSIQTEIRVTVTVEGSDRPACVADTVSRFYF